LAFIIRKYHDARSSECQIEIYVFLLHTTTTKQKHHAAIALQLRFRVDHLEDLVKPVWLENKW